MNLKSARSLNGDDMIKTMIDGKSVDFINQNFV